MSLPNEEPELKKKDLKKLLKNFYGTDKEKTKKSLEKEIYNMSSGQFDSKKYFAKVLKEQTFEQLVRTNNRLNSDLLGYEKKLQLLVYGNYKKFLSATDMLKEMRNSVTNMENELEKLSGNMKEIKGLHNNINKRMLPRRNKIDELSGVHSLLTKLQFLFELPRKLRLCIKMEEYSQGVKFYLQASDVLRRHSSITSFRGILDTCREIIEEMKELLIKQIQNPLIRENKVHESIKLLIELGVRLDTISIEYINRKHSKIINSLNNIYKNEILNKSLKMLNTSNNFVNKNEKIKGQKKEKKVGKGEREGKGEGKKQEEKEKEKVKINVNIIEPISIYTKTFVENIYQFLRSYKKLFISEKMRVLRTNEIDKCENLIFIELENFFNLYLYNISKILFHKRMPINCIKPIIEFILNEFENNLKMFVHQKQLNKIKEMLKTFIEFHLNLKFKEIIYKFKKYLDEKNNIFNQQMIKFIQTLKKKHMNELENKGKERKREKERERGREKENENENEKKKKKKKKKKNYNKLEKRTENEKMMKKSIIDNLYNEIIQFLFQLIQKLAKDLSSLYGIDDLDELKLNYFPFIQTINETLSTSFYIKFLPLLISLLQKKIDYLFFKINNTVSNYVFKSQSNRYQKKKQRNKNKLDFQINLNSDSDSDVDLNSDIETDSDSELKLNVKKTQNIKDEQVKRTKEKLKKRKLEKKREKERKEKKNYKLKWKMIKFEKIKNQLSLNPFYNLVLNKFMNNLSTDLIYNIIGEFSWLFGEGGFNTMNLIISRKQNPKNKPKQNNKLSKQINSLLKINTIENLIQSIKLTEKSLLTSFVNGKAREITQQITRYIHLTEYLQYPTPTKVKPQIKEIYFKFLFTEKILNPDFPSKNKKKKKKKNKINSLIKSHENLDSTSVIESSGSSSRNSKVEDKYSFIDTNIEKLFSNKINIFEQVKPDKDSILSGIGKVVLKSFIENIRHATFALNGLKQIQIDSVFIKITLKKFVESSLITMFTDELLSNAKRRCLDDPVLDNKSVESILQNTLKKI
ncbi:vacuolar protein sorting-associated protein [Anaeramoeba flamelloides]|uniref:Vacuolar protein sorting-associated protein n=1 Tax=Anaeramoeba flamelloides TaxID=1746091 RepID=A0ABQ8X7A2_9EUKA|nr:vacuolar protein sorting-associated protein [Anaeramoeba flamelloides]